MAGFDEKVWQAAKAAGDEAGLFNALGVGDLHARACTEMPDYAGVVEALARKVMQQGLRSVKAAASRTGDRMTDQLAARHDAENRHEPLLPWRDEELHCAVSPALFEKLRFATYFVSDAVGKRPVLEIYARRDWREAVCANLHARGQTLRIEETAVMRDYQVWMELHRRALREEQVSEFQKK